jgi:DNA-binding MarR family transcriptional regulator
MTRQLIPGTVVTVTSATALSDRESAAWRAFMEMQEVLRGHIEQQLQADSGLSNADYAVLVALSEAPDGELRAFNLGQSLGWEKSRLHHQLTRMGRRGLVARRNGEGRTSLAAITAEGRSALEAAVPAHTREVRRLVFDQLTQQQVQQLADISRTVLNSLRGDVSG